MHAEQTGEMRQGTNGIILFGLRMTLDVVVMLLLLSQLVHFKMPDKFGWISPVVLHVSLWGLFSFILWEVSIYIQRSQHER